MDPIQISESLRVVQLDDLQWAVQTRFLSKGEESWQNRSYLGTKKALLQTCQDWIGTFATEKARKKAVEALLTTPGYEALTKLPNKPDVAGGKS